MILKILHHTVNKCGRESHLRINLSLWTYRTNIRTPMGIMPFILVYGEDVLLPIEVEIPTLRISMKGLIIDDDYRISQDQELELLDEHRQVVCDHLRAYQQHMSRS